MEAWVVTFGTCQASISDRMDVHTTPDKGHVKDRCGTGCFKMTLDTRVLFVVSHKAFGGLFPRQLFTLTLPPESLCAVKKFSLLQENCACMLLCEHMWRKAHGLLDCHLKIGYLCLFEHTSAPNRFLLIRTRTWAKNTYWTCQIVCGDNFMWTPFGHDNGSTFFFWLRLQAGVFIRRTEWFLWKGVQPVTKWIQYSWSDHKLLGHQSNCNGARSV